jgi:membrane protein required for colicin V production
VVNIVDIAVIGVVLLSAIVALARGFVREVLSLLGWLIAIGGGVWGYPMLSSYITPHIQNALIANLVAGGAIFFVLLVVTSLLTMAISRMVRESALNLIDRSLGFAFGILRGLVVMSAAYLGAMLLWQNPNERPEMMIQARSEPLLFAGAEALRSVLPAEFADTADAQRRQLDQLMELERLARPTPTRSETPQGYDQDTSSQLDDLLAPLSATDTAPETVVPDANTGN